MREPGDQITHDPEAEEDVRFFDWSTWLNELGTGVTIVESSYEITSALVRSPTNGWDDEGSPVGLTLSDDSIVTGGQETQIKLSGGTLGGKYVVTNRVVASSGAIDRRSFTVLVQNR